MHLPDVFCWSKFGTEAGDEPEMILRRKERERFLNAGVFLWGIGNSIWPSLKQLVHSVESPRVVFTPMLSEASTADSAPTSVVLWRAASAFDNAAYCLPEYSMVTSRFSEGQHGRARCHYALVCRSDSALAESCDNTRLDHSSLRNLVSGAPVGSSQVTSVVKASGQPWKENGRYAVAFIAELAYPYLVRLADPVSVPVNVRKGVAAAQEKAFDELRVLRSSRCLAAATPTLW
jgi:hypothetical protein